jgi:acyl-coenzyme A thioesterase PaaI-like protein
MTDLPQAAVVDPFLAARSDHACFGCGDENPIGLHLRFAAEGNGVKAPFIPGAGHQGFHGVVHGGIISTVLDEAMAWATAHAGIWAVTGEMRVRFRQPLAVGEQTTVTARVNGTRGRVVTTVAELVRDRDRSPIATATATFVTVEGDVEAAWQARYVRESTGATAKLLDVQPHAAESGIDHSAAGPPGDNAPDVEDDQ